MECHPCGICGVHVIESDEAICCDYCSLWHHRECLGMTLDFYLILSSTIDDWICRKCTLKQETKQEAQSSQCRIPRFNIMGKGKELKLECKKLEFLTVNQKCVFCSTSKVDENKYGPIYIHRNIITHYFCLLLSSNMEQNGRDSDGILGFLHSDILKEVKRGSRLNCSFCKCSGATLGCAIGKCKVMFHFPCGMKHGTLHQFFGEFKSFCERHRPVQKISEKILAEANKDSTICGICYEKVIPRPIHETLWAPCCKKNAFFHRECVQKLAVSAGYFFKCPLCNNTDTFQQVMKDFGIYIPEQDASWECVPQAYQDLLVRHETCDSLSCSCPTGRKTNTEGTRWELILCKYCGSQGVHIGCGRLKWRSPEFECNICSTNPSNNSRNSRSIEGSPTPTGNRHRLSGGRQRHRQYRPVEPQNSTPPPKQRDSSSSSDESEPTRPKERSRKTVSSRDKSSSLSNAQIIIDSSSEDDYVEVVSDNLKPKRSFQSDYIKTNDGSVIPVVKIDVKNVEKRHREKEEVKHVVPDEVIDISLKMSGPAKKPKVAQWSETAYDQPSTSKGPSSSYVPPDVNQFMLVDPTSFKAEDIPPGMVLYRSMQPVAGASPQLHLGTPQQMVSQTPTTMPMQQLGSTCNADAKYSNLSKHRCWCSNNLKPHHSKKHSKENPREDKRDSHRRERRRCRRCHTDRLNPVVRISPLKTRTARDGHLEILIRRNLFASNKSRSPLQSKPLKRLKSTKGKYTKKREPLNECPSNDPLNNHKEPKAKKPKQNKMSSKLKVSWNYKKIDQYFIGSKKEEGSKIFVPNTESHEVVRSILADILSSSVSKKLESSQKTEPNTESHRVVRSILADLLSSSCSKKEKSGQKIEPNTESHGSILGDILSPCMNSDSNQDIPTSVVPQNVMTDQSNNIADCSPQLANKDCEPSETPCDISKEIQYEKNENIVSEASKSDYSSEAVTSASVPQKEMMGEYKNIADCAQQLENSDCAPYKTPYDISKKIQYEKNENISEASKPDYSSEAVKNECADFLTNERVSIDNQLGEDIPTSYNDLRPNKVFPKTTFTDNSNKKEKNNNNNKVSKSKFDTKLKRKKSQKAAINKKHFKPIENVLSAQSLPEYNGYVGEGASTCTSQSKSITGSKQIPLNAKENLSLEYTPLSFIKNGSSLKPKVFPKISLTHSSKRKENKICETKDEIELKTKQSPKAGSSKKARTSIISTESTLNQLVAEKKFYNIDYFFKPTKERFNCTDNKIESKQQYESGNVLMTSSSSFHIEAGAIVNNPNSPHKIPLAELQVNSISSTVQET